MLGEDERINLWFSHSSEPEARASARRTLPTKVAAIELDLRLRILSRDASGCTSCVDKFFMVTRKYASQKMRRTERRLHETYTVIDSRSRRKDRSGRRSVGPRERETKVSQEREREREREKRKKRKGGVDAVDGPCASCRFSACSVAA